MHNIYSVLGVSEDDVVIDLRYCIVYMLHEGSMDLSEAWVYDPIIDRFKSYTHQNVVHLNRIAVDHRDCLIFDLQLIDPNIAIQEIVDKVSEILWELLPWPKGLELEDRWREVRIFTVGTPASVEEDLAAYIEAVRRSKTEIRPAVVSEAQAIIDLHSDTVRRVNSADYSPEQIGRWIGKRRVEITESMIQQGQYWVCVDETGKLLGIGHLSEEEITGLYVHADYLREGIGSALLTRLEQELRSRGVLESQVDSTLTAAGFYRKMGYVEIGRKKVGDAMLEVICMRKMFPG